MKNAGYYIRLTVVVLAVCTATAAAVYEWWTQEEREEASCERVDAPDGVDHDSAVEQCKESIRFWREHPGGGAWLNVEGKWVKQRTITSAKALAPLSLSTVASRASTSPNEGN
jgi:hypothetical protein